MARLGQRVRSSRSPATTEFTPIQHHFAPMKDVELTFQFAQLFATQMRKANNDADEAVEYGQLGVHWSTS